MQWIQTEHRPSVCQPEIRLMLPLTDRANIGIWRPWGTTWLPSFHVNLGSFNAVEVSDAKRLEAIKAALAAIDEARPVLVAMIEGATR